MKRFKEILCVVETVEACKPALELAVKLTENNQASLTVVDVVDECHCRYRDAGGGPCRGRSADRNDERP